MHVNVKYVSDTSVILHVECLTFLTLKTHLVKTPEYFCVAVIGGSTDTRTAGGNIQRYVFKSLPNLRRIQCIHGRLHSKLFAAKYITDILCTQEKKNMLEKGI